MKYLISLVCLLFLIAMPSLSKTYLLSVGIADYPGIQNDLRVSANDAKTISRIFLKNGDATVSTLLNSDATVEKVCAEMSRVFALASADDAIILFFSGHGIPGGLVCHDGFLYYSYVTGLMRQSRAQTKIVLVDACYAGKMRSGLGDNAHSGDDGYSKQNVMFFLSSRTTEKSLETPRQSKFHNSLFTVFLERGLRGGADSNKDRTITAKELYSFVHKGVVNASQGRQHPVMWGKFEDEMKVIGW